jgi:hypothetical protein
MNILKKVVEENKKSWDSKLKYAVWADRITTKTSTGKTPFELVYGLEAKLPVNLQIPILRFVQQYDTDAEAIQGRINQLIELDETRRNALGQMIRNQEKVKNTFDHKAKGRSFAEGDLVLCGTKEKRSLVCTRNLTAYGEALTKSEVVQVQILQPGNNGRRNSEITSERFTYKALLSSRHMIRQVSIGRHFRVLYRMHCLFPVIYASCFLVLYMHIYLLPICTFICYCFTGWQYHPVFCR